MPDILPQSATNAETVTPQVQPDSRTELLSRYQQYYDQQTPVAVEPPAAIEPPATQPEPPPTPKPDPYAELFTSLRSEIAGLKQALTPPAPPAEPEPPPPDPLEFLRGGKYEDFVSALTDKIQRQVGGATTQQAVTQALEMFRVENQIQTFLSDLRASNPEITELERLGWLEGPVQQAVYAARQAGKITSPTEYVETYKSAVNTEVEKARNFLQRIRAAGKQEALTSKTEVLRATPLAPQGVQTPRASEGDPSKPQSLEDYFAARKAAEAARQGLRPSA